MKKLYKHKEVISNYNDIKQYDLFRQKICQTSEELYAIRKDKISAIEGYDFDVHERIIFYDNILLFDMLKNKYPTITLMWNLQKKLVK